MKKFSALGVVVALACGALSAGVAHGVTVTFDDLPLAPASSNGVPIPSGYAGLDWDDFFYLQSQTNNYNPSGYQNAGVSSPQVAFSGGASLPIQASFSVVAPASFNLVSGYFTAAWYDGLTLDIVGSKNGVDLFDDSFTINTTSPTFRTLNFLGVDTVVFSPSGGTSSPFGADVPGNEHFVVDDLVITPVATTTAAPEPVTAALAGLGLGTLGLALVRRGSVA